MQNPRSDCKGLLKLFRNKWVLGYEVHIYFKEVYMFETDR